MNEPQLFNLLRGFVDKRRWGDPEVRIMSFREDDPVDGMNVNEAIRYAIQRAKEIGAEEVTSISLSEETPAERNPS